jgi:hypothetical protein
MGSVVRTKNYCMRQLLFFTCLFISFGFTTVARIFPHSTTLGGAWTPTKVGKLIIDY